MIKGYRFFAMTALVSTCLSASAELFEPEVNVSMDARVDYQHGWISGSSDDNGSGFKGKYLDIMINGQINSHFQYAYRQRLNKFGDGTPFFDATDWIYLNYKPNANWDITAGKMVVGIGGFEYDRAPINLYTCSEYWNNIPCYQLGVSAAYTLKNGKDKFMFQVTQSPWAKAAGNSNMYAYNLMWYGNHGIYSSIWSVNLMEYAKNNYISYIALGNKLEYENVSLEFDFMNRATDKQVYLFKDFSVMAEFGWWPISNKLKLFAKGTYDVNRSGNNADLCVYNGTEMGLVGGGVEFYPLRLKKHDVRLHAAVSYTWGKNTNPNGALNDQALLVDVGLTWVFDIIRYKK